MRFVSNTPMPFMLFYTYVLRSGGRSDDWIKTGPTRAAFCDTKYVVRPNPTVFHPDSAQGDRGQRSQDLFRLGSELRCCGTSQALRCPPRGTCYGRIRYLGRTGAQGGDS